MKKLEENYERLAEVKIPMRSEFSKDEKREKNQFENATDRRWKLVVVRSINLIRGKTNLHFGKQAFH